jgi:carbon monoxide dehydrogenase subunit G
MQMTGEQRIAASRHLVWQALNDPEILRQCIPGCQSLERESAERLRATVEIKIGPIGARFNGAVTLSDLDPPNGYTLTGEGQGGTVGSARGAARVCLADDGDGTRLSYDVDAQIGGRLAQLGGPIIDATARQLAGKFFAQLSAMVGPPEAAAPTRIAAAEQTVSATKSPLPPAATQRLPMAWILAVAVAAFVGFLVGRSQPAAAGSDWMGLSIGLLLIIVAAAGFEYGRRTAAPVMMLDAALLARLAGEPKP